MVKLYSHTAIAPELSAVITASSGKNETDEGQSYSLTCTVRGDELLAVSERRFRWDKIGYSMGLSRELTLAFNSILYSDAGEYQCTSILSSPYLMEPLMVTSVARISVHRKFTVNWQSEPCHNLR